MDALPDIPAMKVAELKKELKVRGLSTTGNKTDLVERLQLAVAQPDNPEEEEEEDDSDLLADDTTDLLAEDPVAVDEEEPVAEPAPKVAIKRDTVVPATDSKPEEATTPDKDKPETEAESSTTPKGKQKIIFSPDSSTSTKITILGATPQADDPETKPETETSEVKAPVATVTTDKDRAAARAARFGITASEKATDDKKSTRAARFGLPDAKPKAGSNKIGEGPSVDIDTLKKRAERFGQSSSNSLKSAELQEQIKKRQERFGLVSGPEAKKAKVAVNENLLVDEKLQKRAERFKTEVKA